MANIDMRTREGRAMKAAAEAAKQAAAAGQVLNEVEQQRAPVEPVVAEPDNRVAPDQSPAVIEPRNEPRRAALEEIYERQRREMGYPQDEAEPAAPPQKVEPEHTPAAVTVSEAPVAAGPAPETPPATPQVRTVRVKVDGVEFDAPEDEVNAYGGVRPYQISKANENRLAKTNEALAETRRLQAQLAAFAQQQRPSAPPPKSDVEFIKEKMDIIRFGTPEESAAAMNEVIARGRTPAVDPNQVVSRAVVAMQQQAAEQAFVNEHQDIVTNPLLLKLTIQMKNERLSQLRAIPDWKQFYDGIGNEIRGAIGRPSQPATQPQSAPAGHPSQPDREQRKAATVVNLPTAASRAALPEAPKPETRDDILNEMRKRRGIPTG